MALESQLNALKREHSNQAFIIVKLKDEIQGLRWVSAIGMGMGLSKGTGVGHSKGSGDANGMGIDKKQTMVREWRWVSANGRGSRSQKRQWG